MIWPKSTTEEMIKCGDDPKRIVLKEVPMKVYLEVLKIRSKKPSVYMMKDPMWDIKKHEPLVQVAGRAGRRASHLST